jgi:hypothetical protein
MRDFRVQRASALRQELAPALAAAHAANPSALRTGSNLASELASTQPREGCQCATAALVGGERAGHAHRGRPGQGRRAPARLLPPRRRSGAYLGASRRGRRTGQGAARRARGRVTATRLKLSRRCTRRERYTAETISCSLCAAWWVDFSLRFKPLPSFPWHCFARVVSTRAAGTARSGASACAGRSTRPRARRRRRRAAAVEAVGDFNLSFTREEGGAFAPLLIQHQGVSNGGTSSARRAHARAFSLPPSVASGSSRSGSGGAAAPDARAEEPPLDQPAAARLRLFSE